MSKRKRGIKKSMRVVSKWASANNASIVSSDHSSKLVHYDAIDDITGYPESFSATLTKQGKIDRMTYVNYGSNPAEHDDFQVSVYIDNPNKFIKASKGNLLRSNYFNGGSIDNIASYYSDMKGVSNGYGIPSTEVSFGGDVMNVVGYA